MPVLWVYLAPSRSIAVPFAATEWPTSESFYDEATPDSLAPESECCNLPGRVELPVLDNGNRLAAAPEIEGLNSCPMSDERAELFCGAVAASLGWYFPGK